MAIIIEVSKYGVGVKTGELVVVDLDIPRYELVDDFENLCLSTLGHAPIASATHPNDRCSTNLNLANWSSR